MKQLWRRASGKIKDRNSILMTSLTRKTKHRHPDLEAAVIRATSHDDSCVDYKNAQRVFMWVRTSPSHLVIFLWTLTRRLERTQDWIVALKSLILLHGVLCTKAPGTRKIGRLPFDLSGFQDGYIRDGPLRGACTSFVHAYFVFSDLKSVTLSAELHDEMELPIIVEEKDKIRMHLERVKRWQNLLETVLHVRPYGGIRMTDQVVVLEAMDCMVIEVYELYSKICDGIAKALLKIYSNRLGKAEASIALDVVHKANKQAQDLSDYFEFCQIIGVLRGTECPQIQHILEDDLLELEKIINGNGVSQSAAIMSDKADYKEEGTSNHNTESIVAVSERKDIVNDMERKKPHLKTIITDKWEVFDEDISQAKTGGGGGGGGGGGALVDPFAASSNVPPPKIHFNPFIDYQGKPSQYVLSLL
ncbi:putative clathrin assembly protein At1g25240 [Spinacia oleracea]|uniref:Clathrin assembly protein At1g25240 n=1 Tax=Spinacia oleracea TaxID=3562 RepID=A0A9R0IZE9_SPIOL|nr:putative clathrin assembly protein At1g25240 [Spinacia oleracea]